jgi:hypothetical protein
MANHPLALYLRGHYAGGHTAIRRLREQAASDPTNDRRTFLSALATEIDADLLTLQDVLARLSVRRSPLRNAAATTASVLGRWILRAERPGDAQAVLIGLESLSLGIEGKAKLWQTLGEVSVTEPRLAGIDFAGLSERARRQRRRLEPYRLAAALEAQGRSSARRA